MPYVPKIDDVPPWDRIGTIEIQALSARDCRPGRALIVVEVDEADAPRMLAGIRELADSRSPQAI